MHAETPSSTAFIICHLPFRGEVAIRVGHLELYRSLGRDPRELGFLKEIEQAIDRELRGLRSREKMGQTTPGENDDVAALLLKAKAFSLLGGVRFDRILGLRESLEHFQVPDRVRRQLTLPVAWQIVVAGSITNANDRDTAVWRLGADGTLDQSFGGQGLVVHGGAAAGTAGFDDVGESVLIDDHGRIVVAGWSKRAPTGVTVNSTSPDPAIGG